jgi:hypothetical protein
MNRRQVFYLRIAASLLVMLSILPVSVALNHEIETILGNEAGETDFASRYNESEWGELLTPDGASKVIETVGSMIAVLEANPENPNEMKTALVSLNKNMAQLNASLEYTDGMIEAANSTLGEPDSTTPMTGDMFAGFKELILLLEQF